MKKYVVARKNVCAGQLEKARSRFFKVYDPNGIEIYGKEFNGLETYVSGKTIYRGMLFDVNENGLSNDLIYTTPTNYPIEGIEPKVNIKSDFVIQEYVELEDLLKYLKYGEDLTQDDLNQIYRKLITQDWWLEHHKELFGWRKWGNIGASVCYSSDGIQTIPMNIYNSLSSLSFIKNGRPNKDEPNYSLIKKRK